MATIVEVNGLAPTIGEDVWLAPTAVLIGDVRVRDRANIWFGTVLRGDEWYEFDASTGLISEIRAYYASPQARDLQRLELEGFDYAGRGYSVEPRAGDVDR